MRMRTDEFHLTGTFVRVRPRYAASSDALLQASFTKTLLRSSYLPSSRQSRLLAHPIGARL